MFCMNCGMQLPDMAKFCLQCGTAINAMMPQSAATKLVPAKCTCCDAGLQVDPDLQTAICQYCNTEYIVDQAIQNYNIQVAGNMSGNMNISNATINFAGVNAENLLIRAQEFEENEDYEAAISYYNKVLDIDLGRQEAKDGLERVKYALQNYIYFETDANKVFSMGKMQLKKGLLIYKANSGKEERYNLEDIYNIRKSMGCLVFMYGKKKLEISYGCSRVKEWIGLIEQAQKGKYPERRIY